MLEKLQDTRHFYQYPSMCAPQIGWNVRCVVMCDGTAWINPELVSTSPTQCWAWEPCASCSFFMHFIQRPLKCTVRALDPTGAVIERELSGMRARMMQHELDHLDGYLYTRRIPDSTHVIPLDAFNMMSEWEDDFPSVEARSTFLYTVFVPPTGMLSEGLPDAALLDRKFEDKVYPGYEVDVNYLSASRLHEEEIREMYKKMKRDSEAQDLVSAVDPQQSSGSANSCHAEGPCGCASK